MRKWIVTIVAMGILCAAAFELLPRKTVKAAARPQEAFGTCVSRVPQSWGEYKGGSEQSGVAFEDSHGTLRFVTSFPCSGDVPTAALVVERLPGN
jgi:hypothetical protein